MSYYTMIVNHREYTFNNFTFDNSQGEIYIEIDNKELDLLLVKWFYESVDNGQGINPNYKKDIKIESNNKIHCFEGCWVKNYLIASAKAIISYDYLV
jgi:hypothetical protein